MPLFDEPPQQAPGSHEGGGDGARHACHVRGGGITLAGGLFRRLKITHAAKIKGATMPSNSASQKWSRIAAMKEALILRDPLWREFTRTWLAPSRLHGHVRGRGDRSEDSAEARYRGGTQREVRHRTDRARPERLGQGHSESPRSALARLEELGYSPHSGTAGGLYTASSVRVSRHPRAPHQHCGSLSTLRV